MQDPKHLQDQLHAAAESAIRTRIGPPRATPKGRIDARPRSTQRARDLLQSMMPALQEQMTTIQHQRQPSDPSHPATDLPGPTQIAPGPLSVSPATPWQAPGPHDPSGKSTRRFMKSRFTA